MSKMHKRIKCTYSNSCQNHVMSPIKFLREQKMMHLSTIDMHGMPHTVPVWYAYSRGRIYVGTNTRTAKARNITHNDRVAFCVDVGIHAPGIYGVMGQGRAVRVLDKRRVRERAGMILGRYFDNPDDARDLLDDTDCIIVIRPDRVRSWKY